MKQKILDLISDSVTDLVYYDRKDSESVSQEAFNHAIASGVITIDEMVDEFRKHLENTFAVS